jgi:hypothetical protein
MRRLDGLEASMLAAPDQQISLTDPDSRSMATSGRGSGVVGYNVQVAVDTEHHLIVTHEVTNVGSDRSQLARVAKDAKAALQSHRRDDLLDEKMRLRVSSNTMPAMTAASEFCEVATPTFTGRSHWFPDNLMALLGQVRA